MGSRAGQLPVKIPHLLGLSSVAPEFRLVLCDLWGVVHNGRRAFPEAIECLRHFKDIGITVYLVSNAPRPASTVIPQLRGLGVSDDCYHGVVTSGDITRAAITGELLFNEQNDESAEFLALSKTSCLHLGPERDVALFEGLDCSRLLWNADVKFGAADFILCTGLIDDETETADDYLPLLTEAASQNLLLICANPDLVVMRGANEIPCAGAIAAAYQTLGGKVRYFGKPYPEIYQACLNKWGIDSTQRDRSIQTDPAQVLAIGDSLRTDIAGARRMGFRSVLVTGGIHSEELGVNPGELPKPDKIEAACSAAGVTPDAVIAQMAW